MRLIFEEQNTWKLREASVQKFLRIIWIKLFVIWQVLKPPLRKLSLGRFFRFHKMAKSLWDRLPYFYKQFLKTRKSGLFQMPALFVYKKLLRLSWLRAANFFPCKLSNSRLWTNNEIFLMESITRPCKYELSVRIEVVLNEAIFHQSSS